MPDYQANEIWFRVNATYEKYGPRDHLRCEIAAYLKDIGQVIDFYGLLPVFRTPS